VLDIVLKNWAPLSKLFAPSGVLSWLRACLYFKVVLAVCPASYLALKDRCKGKLRALSRRWPAAVLVRIQRPFQFVRDKTCFQRLDRNALHFLYRRLAKFRLIEEVNKKQKAIISEKV